MKKQVYMVFERGTSNSAGSAFMLYYNITGCRQKIKTLLK
ncbi:hypothetical protein Cst_c27740 [Thermoclostridium stercorarium subsp. stercorarium DSM 8532]|uniref:Uncharacterized protein n=1 Tax=Thermoclostridium stercorarium (strain ATCC 35414 / DSM 8532 / NCIMB 11754) TaxID=1121335 RepID=L7VW04_THES1|nr:hypothetical protein Cst_c27740 [Thermoclostridium stercorarium subsp. stercorarium DSM 8532]